MRAPLIIVGIALALLVATLLLLSSGRTLTSADPANPVAVAMGGQVYATHCATCHGANLEGQANWRERLPSGRLPAPPHDASGHTWHHSDGQLFLIIKEGGQAASASGVATGMPAFGQRLSDEQIWAVLAFIKSRWPADIQALQSQRR